MRTEVRAPLLRGVFFGGDSSGGDWFGGRWGDWVWLSPADEGIRFAVNQSEDAGGAGVVGCGLWSGLWVVKGLRAKG